jgi:hypothetical protein
MCDKHDRSDLLGSSKKLLFSVAILLSISSVGHAETVIKQDFICRHLETLERLDRLARLRGREGIDFMGDQIKTGECLGGLKIGTSVRVDKRSGTDVCVVPLGSSEPCQWVSSEVIK